MPVSSGRLLTPLTMVKPVATIITLLSTVKITQMRPIQVHHRQMPLFVKLARRYLHQDCSRSAPALWDTLLELQLPPALLLRRRTL